MEGVYASTTIDEATKIMYVKIVNVGEGYADGTLNLNNCTIDTNKAEAVTLIRLASANGNDENTLDNPKNIYPQTSTIKASTPNKVDFKVPAFSINILKIKTK